VATEKGLAADEESLEGNILKIGTVASQFEKD
jgi:hypothetical protein